MIKFLNSFTDFFAGYSWVAWVVCGYCFALYPGWGSSLFFLTLFVVDVALVHFLPESVPGSVND